MMAQKNDVQRASKSASISPFMMKQVIERIFNGLDSVLDLIACHDVCREWRKLAPPYILQKFEIQVKGQATDNEGKSYLQTIQDFPNLKAHKYVFENAELNSPNVKTILKKCGVEMKKLTLSYSTEIEDFDDDVNLDNSDPGAPEPSGKFKKLISTQALHDLLQNKAPFLEVLILKEVPGHIIRSKLFPKLAQLQTDPNSQLLLRRIEFFIDRIPKYGSDYSYNFLEDLFSICPHLEEVAVEGCHEMSENELIIMGSLVRTSRIKQLKKLKIEFMCEKGMELLNDNLSGAQLESCDFIQLDEVSSEAIQQFLNQQSPSLKHLQLRLESTGVHFPPMPNLTTLKLLEFSRRVEGPIATLPDFHLHFPKLRLLQLEESWDFIQEILPLHLSLVETPPCLTLRVLQTIPPRVLEPSMEMLGKLFPNLTIIRTGVPLGYETLLRSVWEFCPNITDLILTIASKSGCYGNLDHLDRLGEMHKVLLMDEEEQQQRLLESLGWEPPGAESEEEQLPKTSLDSIFSGISDTVIQANFVSEKSHKELAQFDFSSIRSGPSICDLKKLRRVSIGGFGGKLLQWDFTFQRDDIFSNLSGYSTFAYLGPEITFFQLDSTVHKMSPKCRKFICSQMRLTEEKRFPFLFRLIKSGCGYEQIGFIPPVEWFGYGEDRDGEPQWEEDTHGS